MFNLRVLLIFESPGKFSYSISALPPQGILSIAAYLEEHGIKTDVVDYCVPQKEHFNFEEYDLIGFSANISNREKTLKHIASIRGTLPSVQIVVGGPLAMSNPEVFMDNEAVDAVFICEGEEALFEYITSDDRTIVKGIYLKSNDGYIHTGDRPWIASLDHLPYPALDKVDISQYRSVPSKKSPITSVMTSRGCPFKCIYCSNSMGAQWRPRSAENVVDEIRWYVEDLGVSEICVYDDNFSLDKSRVGRICDLIVDQDITVKIQFTNGLRADSLDEETLKKLKDAGTWLIGLAPETGNPEIMKKIRKGSSGMQTTWNHDIWIFHDWISI
jgi:radical SAM superfamily enzyme YgiQ (UPF0313 family)